MWFWISCSLSSVVWLYDRMAKKLQKLLITTLQNYAFDFQDCAAPAVYAAAVSNFMQPMQCGFGFHTAYPVWFGLKPKLHKTALRCYTVSFKSARFLVEMKFNRTLYTFGIFAHERRRCFFK